MDTTSNGGTLMGAVVNVGAVMNARPGSEDLGEPVAAWILLVADDRETRNGVAFSLARVGFAISACATLAEARGALAQGLYDLVVVDEELPDGDGLALVTEVSPMTPVVVVTRGRDPHDDQVRGLRAGADDSVVGPWSIPELAARVAAVVRRAGRVNSRGRPEHRISYDGFELDLGGRQAWVDGAPVPFTRKEFDVLAAMATRPGRVCSREELMDWVWHLRPDRAASTTLTEHIRRVRAKLGRSPAHRHHIVTVHGVGYRFDP